VDQAQRFAPNPQVLLTELGDGTGVLLHLDTKFYYTLNDTGIFVWKALADTAYQTSTTLAARLAKVFNVSVEAAERDVDAILAEMSNEGLVCPPLP
jgi:phosphoribosylformylglycinamidine (FGAM) synthase PurS component